jgi:cGMP-dependent protein kinase
MSLCSVESGTVLFKQGNIGFFFYILREGSVDLYINEELKKTIKTKESFGELALLHNSPRSGTVKAITDCEFWVLERKNFRKIVEFISQINFEENKKFIQSIPILCTSIS